MIVGMGDDPSIGEYERLLLTTKTTARKELVLLHPDRSVPQGSTREWLKVMLFVLGDIECVADLMIRSVHGFTRIIMLSCPYVPRRSPLAIR